MACVARSARPNWMEVSRPATGDSRPKLAQTGHAGIRPGSRRGPDAVGGPAFSRGRTMRGRIVAQLVLAVVAAGCGGASLQEYTSPEGRFRVTFPGKAGVKEEMIPTPMGPIISKIAATKDRSRIERAVVAIDFPGRLANRAVMEGKLDSVCQSWADDNNMILSSQGPILLNGHPGRELAFESRPGHEAGKLTGRARFYMVGTHLYEVIIAGPAGRLTSELSDGFLDSFALLDQGPGPFGPEMAGGPPPISPPPGFPPPTGPIPPDAHLQRPRAPSPAQAARSRPRTEPGRSRWPSTTSPSRPPRRSRPISRGSARQQRTGSRASLRSAADRRHRSPRPRALRYRLSSGSTTTRTWWAVTAMRPEPMGPRISISGSSSSCRPTRSSSRW